MTFAMIIGIIARLDSLDGLVKSPNSVRVRLLCTLLQDFVCDCVGNRKDSICLFVSIHYVCV